MMKRILIACYLVLYTYFSFAQGGEVVLEIPIVLRKPLSGDKSWSGDLIANKDKSKYALLLRDYSDFHVIFFNKDFQIEKNIFLPTKSNDFNNFLDGFFVGEECRLIFSDNKGENFTMLSVNPFTEDTQTITLPVHLGEDGTDDQFLQSFYLDNKYYFLTILPNQPILYFCSIDENRKFEKITFDLSKDFPNQKQLWLNLNLESKKVIKIDESTDIDLITGLAINKLYFQEDNKVVMSMAALSKVLIFDLSAKMYEIKHYKALPITIDAGGIAHRNMVIHNNRIYQVGTSGLGFNFSIKTLQDSTLYEYKFSNNDKKADIPFKNGNYWQENNDYGITRSSINKLTQFLDKIENLNKVSGFSVIMNELDSGKIMLSMGAVKMVEQQRGSGGLVSMGGGMTMTGSMGTPMGNVPIHTPMGNTRTYVGDINSRYIYVNCTFFDALFDEKSGQPIKKNIDNEAYIAFRAKLALRKVSPNTYAIITLKTKDGYLLGYYDTNTEKKTKPEKYVFVFFKK